MFQLGDDFTHFVSQWLFLCTTFLDSKPMHFASKSVDTPGILHAKTIIRSETIFSQPRAYFWSLVGNLIIEKFFKFVKLFLVRVFLGGYLRAIGRKRVSRGLK